MNDHPGAAPRVVVLGLGNPLRGDDAAGLRVVEALSRLSEAAPLRGVEFKTSTRAGLELIWLLEGFTHAIVVDCLDSADPHPGRVRPLALDACPGSARLTGAHDLSLRDVIELARAAGHAMPGEVAVYGIEAADTLAIHEGLSPSVERAVQTLAADLHAGLTRSIGRQPLILGRAQAADGTWPMRSDLGRSELPDCPPTR